MDGQFEFSAGETIHTENSYKFTVPQFRDIANRAGFIPQQVWLDDAGLFSVHVLLVP